MWNKVLYYFLLLTIIVFQVQASKIKKNSFRNQYTSVAKALVHVFKYCGQQYDTVIIEDDDNGYVVEALSNLEPMTSRILYADLKMSSEKIEHIKKIDAIIINEKTVKELEMILDDFKQSTWWTGLIPHFILKTVNNSYSDAVTWNIMLKNDIPMAYIIDQDELNRVIITTMNPFVDYAPFPWNFSTSINNKSTSYSRFYKEKNICQEFYFDRTKKLNGRKINFVYSILVANNPSDPTILGNSTYDKKSMENVLIEPILYQLRMIISMLNITVKIRFVTYGSVENPNHDLYKKKEIDLTLFSAEQISNEFMENVFPTNFFKIGFLVQNRGYKTPSEKVWEYYGPCTLVSMILILFITFIVLALHNRKKDLAFSTFEILRLLINTAIYTKLNSRPLKIFFSVIFLYFLIIHATFSGHIIEFLTKHELRENPNTFQDLNNPRYKTFYIPEKNYSWINELGLKKEKSIVITHLRDFLKCFEAVERSESNVCVHPHNMLSVYSSYRRMVQKDKRVHQPAEGFGFLYSLYQIRKQLTIKHRIHKIFLWFWETGHSDTLATAKKWIIDTLKKRKRKFVEVDLDHVPLSFDILIFAFITLGVGLTCAFVSFIAEINNVKLDTINILKYKK